MNRSSRLWMIALLAGTFAASARAADPAAETDSRQELGKVRAQIAALQETVAQQAKDLYKLQHDLEYQDPESAQLREEIKSLEQRLLRAREQLKARMSLLPGVRELERKRKQSFKELQDLREMERQLVSQVAREAQLPAATP